MKNRFLFSALSLSLVLLTACSPLDNEHYQQLKSGMSKTEVIAILGNADECHEVLGFENCTWGDEERHIKVTFAGDAAIGKTAKNL